MFQDDKHRPWKAALPQILLRTVSHLWRRRLHDTKSTTTYWIKNILNARLTSHNASAKEIADCSMIWAYDCQGPAPCIAKAVGTHKTTRGQLGSDQTCAENVKVATPVPRRIYTNRQYWSIGPLEHSRKPHVSMMFNATLKHALPFCAPPRMVMLIAEHLPRAATVTVDAARRCSAISGMMQSLLPSRPQYNHAVLCRVWKQQGCFKIRNQPNLISKPSYVAVHNLFGDLHRKPGSVMFTGCLATK